MDLKISEKRQKPRISFKPDKPLTAQVLFDQKDSTPMKVNIINISEAGLCFYFAKKENASQALAETASFITKGVHLILLKIEGEALLQDINDVDMTVLWSASMETLNSELHGCRFLNLLSDHQIKLREFIHNLMASKFKSEK